MPRASWLLLLYTLDYNNDRVAVKVAVPLDSMAAGIVSMRRTRGVSVPEADCAGLPDKP